MTDKTLDSFETQRKAFEAQFGTLESMGFEDKTRTITNMKACDNKCEDIVDTSFQTEDKSKNYNRISNEKIQTDETSVLQKSDQNRRSSRYPKVIKFNGPSDIYIPPTKKEQKILKSGKAPKERSISNTTPKSRSEVNEEDDLKNDLELDRFIRESHILSTFQNETSGSEVMLDMKNNNMVGYKDDDLCGKARLRTLEMRLNQLSDTNCNRKLKKLEKVPMNIRKGMIKKHMGRINKFEQDAKEGGIILSKVKKGEFRKITSTYKKDIERRIGTNMKSKIKTNFRERSLKINTVGKSTRNGLKISSQEIKRVQGESKNITKRKRR